MSELDPSLLEGENLVTLLGIQFEELGAERAVATMPVTPRHHQPLGYLHGGASVVLAETVASVGGTLGLEPGQAASARCARARCAPSASASTAVAPRRSGRSRFATIRTGSSASPAARWRWSAGGRE
jgi:1,4-dihydroxy-2-naphthoyl-CoA hydrolase